MRIFSSTERVGRWRILILANLLEKVSLAFHLASVPREYIRCPVIVIELFGNRTQLNPIELNRMIGSRNQTQSNKKNCVRVQLCLISERNQTLSNLIEQYSNHFKSKPVERLGSISSEIELNRIQSNLIERIGPICL